MGAQKCGLGRCQRHAPYWHDGARTWPALGDARHGNGVRNVYVSQLENNHASPSLPMLRKIAEVTGVTVGFLLMETDHPYPVKGKEREPEPVYFSPEADAVAKLVDNAPPEERARIMAVVSALAGADAKTQQQPATLQHNVFAQRLIAGERVSQDAGKVRA